MRTILLSILAVTTIVTGCTSFKMAVSDDLKPAYDEYKVKGRQGILIKQKMSFGEYKTNTVHRSWTKGYSGRSGIGYTDPFRQEWINIISVNYTNKNQTNRYEMSSGVLQSEVYCVSRFNAEDLEIGRNPNSILNIGMDLAGAGVKLSSIYYVQIFTSANDNRPWELVLDNTASQAVPHKYIGRLAKSSYEYYDVVPVTKVESSKGKTANTPMGSIGFEFRNKDGKTVAAVSLMDQALDYLGKTTAEERFLLANACTALLLQEVIG
jgi:hypothetical protein